MAIAATSMFGLSMRFFAKIGNFDLVNWTKVSGLEVAWDLVEHRSGDGDNERWICPGLTKYPTVKLERAAEKTTSGTVQTWLNSNSFKYEAQSGTIELRDGATDVVATWTLNNVIPIKWSISPFDAKGSTVALETLELAHTGFLTEEK